MRLLSTKILSQNFRERILMHKFSLVEQAFIKISFLENPKIDGIFDRLIFTSQNAVTAVFSSPKIQKMMEGKRFYCVGKKTASLLAENGQKVAKVAQNSLELAHFLAKNYQNESFSYFCGKLRTPDLEEILPVRAMPKVTDLKMSIVFVWETLPQRKLRFILPNTPSPRSPVSLNFFYH